MINGRCSQEIIPVQIPNCVEVRDNQCARCENGYEVRGGLCFIVQPDKILNCLNQQEFFCLECIERYYLSDNQCMQIGNGCNTYNKFTGICDTCYPGYEPNSGKCLIAQIDNKANHDPNCLQTQGDICQKCSNRYYYNGDKCVPVNPLCRDYNNITGACTTCYPSYQVSDSKCILAPSGDPNCKVNQNGVCLECYQSFYPSNGKCVRVNVLCKTFNKFDGRCETCYKGYRVSNGNCVIHFQDPNCKEFDANENCIQCVNKHYVSGNKCVPVNPNCKEHN